MLWVIVQALWYLHLFFPPLLAKTTQDFRRRVLLTVALGSCLGLGLGKAITAYITDLI